MPSKQDRIMAIQGQPFLVDDKHGHTRAILGLVKNLFDLVAAGINRSFHAGEERNLTSLQVVAIRSHRLRKRLINEKGFMALMLASQLIAARQVFQVANSGQRNIVQEFSFREEKLQPRGRVLLIMRKNLSADDIRAAQHSLALGN